MMYRNWEHDVAMTEMPLTQFALRHAARLANKPALIDGLSGQILTYRQLVEGVRRVGIGLSRRGFRRGGALAIYSPNLPEYAVAFHAAAALGGVAAMADPLCGVEDLADQLNDAGASCLLTTSALLGRAFEAAVRSRVRVISTFDQIARAAPFAESFDAEPQSHEAPTQALIKPQDPVALFYADGVDGLERVKQTHGCCVADLRRMAASGLAQEDDVLISTRPFSRPDGFRLLNYALCCGATLVTLPRYEPGTFLSAMREYGVTRAFHAPPGEENRHAIFAAARRSGAGFVYQNWLSAFLGPGVEKVALGFFSTHTVWSRGGAVYTSNCMTL
jgi:acyl-coenzyme A synthetase/AMP-(fatty) acid ligase